MTINRDALLQGLVDAAIEAGAAIMTIYDSDFAVDVKKARLEGSAIAPRPDWRLRRMPRP